MKMRLWGTWKVRHSGTQEWQLNRAAKEAQHGNV